MPISHALKCIFVHIPKCAGTSIEKSLNMFGDNPDTLFGYDHENQVAKQHLTITQMLDLNYISLETFDTYFKFAFIRNPYDRAVSSAAYHGISLSQFLNNPKEFEERRLHGIPFSRHIIQHLKPQNEYVCYKSKPAVDFIGRYEHLEQDWAFIVNRLGVSCQLTHHNKSKHSNYRKYYNLDENRLADHLYQEDFKMFGYRQAKLPLTML